MRRWDSSWSDWEQSCMHYQHLIKKPPPQSQLVPQLFPTGRPEALAPGEPFSPQPHPSCSACPDRALPRHAVLRAAAAARRGGLGTPPAPRATMAAGGGERRERRGENAV